MKHFLFEFTKSNFQNQNDTTMVMPCHAMYIPDIFKNFHQVLSSCHPLLLAVQVSLCLLPLVWPGLIHESIGPYAQGLWHSGTVWLSVLALYLLLSVCFQVSVLLSGSTLVLDPWLPWLVRVVEIIELMAWMSPKQATPTSYINLY